MIELQVAIVFFLVAQAADVYTTEKALKLPNLKEANPIVLKLMGIFDENWWIVKLVISFGVMVILALANAPGWIMILSVVTLAVAFSNLLLIRKYK